MCHLIHSLMIVWDGCVNEPSDSQPDDGLGRLCQWAIWVTAWWWFGTAVSMSHLIHSLMMVWDGFVNEECDSQPGDGLGRLCQWAIWFTAWWWVITRALTAITRHRCPFRTTLLDSKSMSKLWDQRNRTDLLAVMRLLPDYWGFSRTLYLVHFANNELHIRIRNSPIPMVFFKADNSFLEGSSCELSRHSGIGQSCKIRAYFNEAVYVVVLILSWTNWGTNRAQPHRADTHTSLDIRLHKNWDNQTVACICGLQ